MLEEKLKSLIKEKFGSVRQFSFKIGIPYTTVDTILKRGIDNSNVGNVIKMCKALDISIDNLLDSKEIMPNIVFDNIKSITSNEDIVKNENFSELDNLLWSKAKELNDEEKKAVLQVMNAIHKDVDKEIDNN